MKWFALGFVALLIALAAVTLRGVTQETRRGTADYAHVAEMVR